MVDWSYWGSAVVPADPAAGGEKSADQLVIIENMKKGTGDAGTEKKYLLLIKI